VNFWPDCKPEGPLFSAEFVCLSVSLPFNVDRLWRNLVTRTVLWSSLAVTIMVHIGRRGTAWRLFENLKKNSQKSQNSYCKIHFLRVYCKKNSTQFEQNWWRRYILKSAPIAIRQVWTRHPVQCYAPAGASLQAPTRCDVPVAQRMTAFAAGRVWHRHAAKRYVQKLDIGRVHKFGMECVRKFGICARSKHGIGHDVRRAFRTGGIRTWGRNRAVKTNRLVRLAVTYLPFPIHAAF